MAAAATAPIVGDAVDLGLSAADKAVLAKLTTLHPRSIFVCIHPNGALYSYPFSVWSARFNLEHIYSDRDMKLVFGWLDLGHNPSLEGDRNVSEVT